MAKRVLFRVTTPLGYTVALARNRWREITRYKHPALASQHALVRDCLQQPKVVRESQKDSQVHLYYASTARRYVCVVVGPSDAGQHLVITAYFTRDVKKGNELWKS